MAAANIDDFDPIPGENVEWGPLAARATPTFFRRLSAFSIAAISLVVGVFALLSYASMLDGAYALWVASLVGMASAVAIFRGGYQTSHVLITDRRIIIRRQGRNRALNRRWLSMLRVRWNQNQPFRGAVELLVATPFGPLHRKLRLVVDDIEGPDRLVSFLRRKKSGEFAGAASTPIRDRLEEGEEIVWSGRPAGWMVGLSEFLQGIASVALLFAAFDYSRRSIAIIVDLEARGVIAGSSTWTLLVIAVGMTAILLFGLGAGGLLWTLRQAYVGKRQTSYYLTNSRVILCREAIELTIPLNVIVGTGRRNSLRGLEHIFLLIDGPQASGLGGTLLEPILPRRDGVPPVLFEMPSGSTFSNVLSGLRGEQK